MNKDNISALVTALAVISLIIGFGIYFNFYGNASHSYLQQQQLEKSVDQSITKKGDILTVSLNKTAFVSIDKSGFLKAPDLTGIDYYINTMNNQPIKLSDLKGKVVLLDFWTYTCINCIRTIPYLNDWYARYADQGFVIVGVHSPEFDFEKDPKNVQNAVNKFDISYPVVLDSEHKTWDAFNNNYWPRHYLIDTQGYIRDDHIGEGGYNETEKTIQTLLAEKATLEGKTEISFNLSKSNLENVTANSLTYVDPNQRISPEIYLGYSSARSSLGNTEGFHPDQQVDYKIKLNNTQIQPNLVYLNGTWKNNADNIELVSNAGKIILTYYAKSINVVASGKGQQIKISEDNKFANNTSNNAIDIDKEAKVIVDNQRLYNIGLYDDYEPRSIVMDIKGKGLQIYTFTFG
ncbi:redoxin domain-containing protein [Candidatus Nitrosocosmicus agrestis]|jgi:thiol-disulfide isomerase/thioredoxin|uniref:redoxin domain-containing protein n=1 Tax=Candidatus Nitrosocosmicus agrestis TaxID=2563600 RepID=UPI00122E54E4|nr:redoxin domain-containing protein [Candidatus Nitrosocosmicus sp. SS]KAA2282869.1 redoxin domain-containing protein [Candidatus Nitrosocosmicus sp. SS]KAF0869071.1 redoxin domain-containing protein [Candidatus Nitrosocosmicus sp. SS]MDR4489582.1 redoxin domain-containing protein [Candidatus Nitrosocosmicus sp.]